MTAVEKNALAAAVTAAKTVNDNSGAAETEVSDAVTALNSAIAAFDAAKESGVKPAAAPGDTLITAAPVTGIDMPVVHGTPDGTADETPQYTAVVAWELGYGDRFKPETAYTAQVLLTAKPGYTFLGGYNDDASVAGFTVNGIIPTQAQFTVSEYDGRTHLSFKVTFSPTEGSEPLKTVTPGPIDGVTSPVAGALPSRDISGGADYTAEISDWFITDNLYSERIDETKPFEDGKVYSIRVKLTAEPGYAFWDVSKGRIAGGHAGVQQDPALVAEAEAIVDSFTVNGAKPGMIDITIRFEITPYEIWFYLPFPETQEVPAAPPPVTPPTIPGNEGEVQIDYVYRTGSGQVTLNFPEDKVGELIAGAKAAGHVVDINLTGVPGTTESVTKVNLPVGALGSISAESLLLSLRFPDGTASISAEALGSFTGEVIAAGGENLSVTLRGAPSDALNAAQRAAVKTGESVYQISVQNQAETGEMHSFSGSFSVTLPYGGRVPNAVWCLRDDGTKESVSYTVNSADKTVTINLPHLSLYGLSYETTPTDTDTDTGNSAAVAVQMSAANSNGIPFTGDVSDTYMVWILLMVLSAGSLAVLFLQKKKMKNNR